VIEARPGRTVFGRSMFRFLSVILAAAAFGVGFGPARAQGLSAPRVGKAQVGEAQIECLTYAPGLAQRYLLALNHHPSVLRRQPPYRSHALRLDADCKLDLFESITSDQQMMAFDLRPFRAGYVYAPARAVPDRWNPNHAFFDRKGQKTAPPARIPDLPIGIHESIVETPHADFYLIYERRLVRPGAFETRPRITAFSHEGHEVWSWSADADPAAAALRWSPIGPPGFADNFHMNGVSPTRDWLVATSRNTDSVLLIDYVTRRIRHVVSPSSFRFLRDGFNGFLKPHHATITPRGTLLLFDNGWVEDGWSRVSRAVEYKLDLEAKTAELIWEYRADPNLAHRETQGSILELADGTRLIGWGGIEVKRGCDAGAPARHAVFTHLAADNSKLFEATVNCGWTTYRVYPDHP
jgi:hypothetical protein